MKNLDLDRPLVIFDLETTGIDPATDKIVEVATLRVEPDGTRQSRTRRLNPGRPIPAGATRVHGITDDDVRDEPTFERVARGLLEFLAGADLAGFNVRRFDAPLLDREFKDCGMDFGLADRRIVDAMTIFHRKERRDLSAAVRFYLDRDHDGAHSAGADVEATLAVLEAQLERYADVPQTVEELDAWTRSRPNAVDQSGKFVWKDGEVTLAFGKHQGKKLADLARDLSGYLDWIIDADFPDDVKTLARQALKGELPHRDQSA